MRSGRPKLTNAEFQEWKSGFDRQFNGMLRTIKDQAAKRLSEMKKLAQLK